MVKNNDYKACIVDREREYNRVLNSRVITKPRVMAKEKLKIDKIFLAKVIFLISLIIFMASFRLSSKNTLYNLGKNKEITLSQIEKNNYEIAEMEAEIVNKYNVRKLEEKSEELGFIYNDKVEYVKQ